MHKFLGNTMQDKITGFKGVVIGYCQYITGCNQFLLQPPAADNGDFKDSWWIDEQRCSRVGKDSVSLDNTKTPGFGKSAPKTRSGVRVTIPGSKR